MFVLYFQKTSCVLATTYPGTILSTAATLASNTCCSSKTPNCRPSQRRADPSSSSRSWACRPRRWGRPNTGMDTVLQRCSSTVQCKSCLRRSFQSGQDAVDIKLCFTKPIEAIILSRVFCCAALADRGLWLTCAVVSPSTTLTLAHTRRSSAASKRMVRTWVVWRHAAGGRSGMWWQVVEVATLMTISSWTNDMKSHKQVSAMSLLFYFKFDIITPSTVAYCTLY